MGYVNHDPELLEEIRGWDWGEYESKMKEIYPHFFEEEGVGKDEEPTAD